MPTVVNLTAAAAAPRRGRDRGWTPFIDWTGHIYKPPSELRITDYSQTGRDVNHGPRIDAGRKVPSMPGGNHSPYLPGLHNASRH